jgi:hypothetical protein
MSRCHQGINIGMYIEQLLHGLANRAVQIGTTGPGFIGVPLVLVFAQAEI